MSSVSVLGSLECLAAYGTGFGGGRPKLGDLLEGGVVLLGVGGVLALALLGGISGIFGDLSFGDLLISFLLGGLLGDSLPALVGDRLRSLLGEMLLPFRACAGLEEGVWLPVWACAGLEEGVRLLSFRVLPGLEDGVRSEPTSRDFP